MTEFQVVFKDLLAASKAFQRHGKEFADIVPKEGPSVPHVTDPGLRAALPQVMRAIAVMHDAVAASMEAHAIKLQHAHDVYSRTEEKNRKAIEKLAQVLSNPEAIQ